MERCNCSILGNQVTEVGMYYVYYVYLLYNRLHTTRLSEILANSTYCQKKQYSISGLVMFPGNTSRIIEYFRSSCCIISEKRKMERKMVENVILSKINLIF